MTYVEFYNNLNPSREEELTYVLLVVTKDNEVIEKEVSQFPEDIILKINKLIPEKPEYEEEIGL